MNRIIQPDNIVYHENGTPKYKIANFDAVERVGATFPFALGRKGRVS